jgi:hypothetical protein
MELADKSISMRERSPVEIWCPLCKSIVATQYCLVDWEKFAKKKAEINEAIIREIANGILDLLLEGGFLMSAPKCIN